MSIHIREYSDLIRMLGAMPKPPVPDRFTERVMERLPELDRGIMARVRRALLNLSCSAIQSRRAQTLPVSSARECSFCFFTTGFFYLVMGIVLMAGLRTIGSSMAAMDWILLQPYLSIGAAIWLFALGMVLLMDGGTAIKMVRYGTLVYVVFAVVNGVLMQPYLQVPYTGVFAIGFVATSALLGVMLSLAIQQVKSRTL